jgi:hypothetical protein
MDSHDAGPDSTGPDSREIPEPVETETRRATGMGNPGTFPDDRDPEVRVRRAAGSTLDQAALRVRQLGDRAADRNPVLGRARPIVYNAADGIEGAADYVRTHELDEMRSDLEAQIRRHPLIAVGVAFLAGYAVRRIF